MTRHRDRENALILRKRGMSYTQIKKNLKVGKSTLSYWLRGYPLSETRIRELRDWNEERIERCRETKRKKREERLTKFYQKQKEWLFPLKKNDLYLAGLFLYLGEGARSNNTKLSLSNTDTAIIKFFIAWLTKNLSVPKDKLKIQLHLYGDMEIEREMDFWSKLLDVPFSRFNSPYIKKGHTKKISHKGGFGHGTCNISIGNARLTEEILMALKSIRDYFLNEKL